jgi:hypothetical protein
VCTVGSPSTTALGATEHDDVAEVWSDIAHYIDTGSDAHVGISPDQPILRLLCGLGTHQSGDYCTDDDTKGEGTSCSATGGGDQR